MEPLLILDRNNEEIVIHFFQREHEDKRIKLSEELEIWPYGGYDFDKNKKEILLHETGYGISKYNYVTGEIIRICSFEDMNNWRDFKDYRFIPRSSDISFIKDYGLYIWQDEQQKCKQIYDFGSENNLKKLGFAYEWKDDDEIYLIKNQNFVLYNIVTQKEEILIDGIGDVYFHMSEDGKYMSYQEQHGENREIILVNLDSKQEKNIHVSKSSEKVITVFSPDSKYIFIYDNHPDTQSGIKYLYLYDINMNKKMRVELDISSFWQLIGW